MQASYVDYTWRRLTALQQHTAGPGCPKPKTTLPGSKAYSTAKRMEPQDLSVPDMLDWLFMQGAGVPAVLSWTDCSQKQLRALQQCTADSQRVLAGEVFGLSSASTDHQQAIELDLLLQTLQQAQVLGCSPTAISRCYH